MRRWIASPFIFAAAFGLIVREPESVSAQPKDGPVAETFNTADGMQLHGLFHATNKNPSGAPVVVFMYPPGPDRDMTKGDWAGLAKKLNDEGYHVFQFDWRGHGKSTKITDKQKFWNNPYLNGRGNDFNALIKVKPGAGSFTFKDITNPTKFMPAYLTDLAAVRVHLDSKNDNKDLNTSSIYIVGAGDATALGMAWMTAEWNRPATFPNVNLLGLGVPGYEYIPQRLTGEFVEAGGDFGAAVWLTPNRPQSFPVKTLQNWIAPPRTAPPGMVFAPKMRENNPMLFIYAEKDSNGDKQAKFFYNEVLVAEPKKGGMLEPVEMTKIFVVKGGEQLQGVKLLGQDASLKTETTIAQYFAAIQKQRQKLASKTRKYDTPYYIDARYLALSP